MGILGRRSGVAVALAAGLMTVLSACSDPAQPATLPSKSATATTAAPTTSTPEPPTAEEEVEQFIRDYYAELTRAARTQDVSRLKKLSTRGCPCYVYVQAIRSSKSQGLTTPDVEWRAESVVVRVVNEADAVVGVQQVLEPYDALDRQGKVIEHYALQEAKVDFSLVKTNGGWIIGNTVNLDGR